MTILSIVRSHGRPVRHCTDGEIFNVGQPVAAAAGYGVLMANFRGSSGYGDAYDLADVLQAVDVAVEQGLADSTRCRAGR